MQNSGRILLCCAKPQLNVLYLYMLKLFLKFELNFFSTQYFHFIFELARDTHLDESHLVVSVVGWIVQVGTDEFSTTNIGYLYVQAFSG